MTRKNSGYTLRYDPAGQVWYVSSWTRLSEFNIHSEAATEDFASYAEAEQALKELENHA